MLDQHWARGASVAVCPSADSTRALFLFGSYDMRRKEIDKLLHISHGISVIDNKVTAAADAVVAAVHIGENEITKLIHRAATSIQARFRGNQARAAARGPSKDQQSISLASIRVLSPKEDESRRDHDELVQVVATLK